MKTKVFCSHIRRRDMDSVLSCIVSDENGQGLYREKFLSLAKEHFGFETGLALRSPIIALETALDCLSLDAGSKIIVSSISPSFYKRVIDAKGFECLYADVDPDTAQVSDTEISRLMTSGGRALVLFEPFGFMPEIEKIAALGLPIIEDISHSAGAYSGIVKAGMTGLLTIMGMEHGGIITSGGGALVFAGQKREAAVLKNMGESLPAELMLPDMNAALAFTQLKEMTKFFEKRKELYSIMSRPLLQSRHALLAQSGDGEPSWYAFPVVLKSGMKDVRAYAKKKEVETEEAFAGSLITSGVISENECPGARTLALRCLLFPLHPAIGKSQAQKIVKVLATLP